ncbi:HNH endonuclease [Altericroceibacterium xinjiangense]|uniref:HNH endonuclease n=1 Tax=Altericroceibacterium xinjiangense TaxID=762261 RepID=UPI0013DFB7D3|nr:HNH endonuclease signature motif containing protein [Altericroceibacterium xinjiangense]
MIIRSRSAAIGLAEIETVEKENGEKERLHCPVCGVGNIKKRVTMFPPWMCKKGHGFEDPVVEQVPVIKYTAHYGGTFVPCPSLPVARVHEAVLRPSDQMSIKEIDLAALEPFLDSELPIDSLIRHFAGTVPVPELATENEPSPASVIETRRRILREIALRRGQRRFRDRLIKRYGPQCQVSGCHFPGLIEAAHIRPYSTSEDNGAGNGLLLRSDLHTLFDLGLLGIDPGTLQIALHPALFAAGYAEFGDRTLLVNGTSGPGRAALEERWQFFKMQLEAAVADA